MAGKPSLAMIAAIRLAMSGEMTPYAASKLHGLGKCSIYRNPIYKKWSAGDIEGARRDIEEALKPRHP